MVREIVHVQVGQCGNQIGTSFWETMMAEHNLDNQGRFQKSKDDSKKTQDENRLNKIGVYFTETGKQRYVPRSILVDLEPGTMDVIKASPIGAMFKPDNFIFGASGAGNNWAKGHFTEGQELIDELMDTIRREMEGCDAPQGFQITHSLGGGTGSGLGTLLLCKMRTAFPDRVSSTFSVYPSPRVSDVVVEPYNATLAIHQLTENTDQTFVIDNEALFTISQNTLKQKNPKYSDLNWVISLVMSGITSSLRFTGKLNADLRKLGVNLVPFPRLHFFCIAEAPLFAPGQGKKVNLNVQELADQVWSSKNFLSNVKPQNGRYFSASCAFRGDIPSYSVDDEMVKIQMKLKEDFIDWIPNNILSSVIDIPPQHTPKSATFVANTTAIKDIFKRISKQFHKMYKAKAFLHWYKGEGMDEMEFQEADKNTQDLVHEYQEMQDAVVELVYDDPDDDGDYEDEDDDDDDAAGPDANADDDDDDSDYAQI